MASTREPNPEMVAEIKGLGPNEAKNTMVI